MTANHAPRVKAPADQTIPIRTPFTLEGYGHDADHDRLIYLWEQNDTGAATGTPLFSEHKTSGALFRVFGKAAQVSPTGTLTTRSPGENLANTSAQRTFPDMAQVLADDTDARTGRCPPAPPTGSVPRRVLDCFSEWLPGTGYVGTAGSRHPAMHFRLTARDTRLGGGGTGHDDVVLHLDPHAGPFVVTSQPRRTTLRAGSRIPVTWAVNGTRALAARVQIRLSTDGGRTWQRVLARSTPNDGSQTVLLPHLSAARARIEIRAVGNYFFALNNAYFAIDGG